MRHADCVREAARAFAARYRFLALDPDDLTQEGLIVAHRVAARIAPGAVPYTDAYYVKAARNRFMDLVRRGPGSVRLVGLDKATLIEAPPDRIDEAELARVEAAVATLAPPAPYILRHHGNPEAGQPSTNREIGVILGLCRRQVIRIKVRAIAALRVALGV